MIPEIAIGGFTPLMTSAHCPIGDLRGKGTFTEKNCRLCTKGHYFLKDRKGRFYAVFGNEEDCMCMIISVKNKNDSKN